MAFEIGQQIGAVTGALFALPEGVDFESDAVEPEVVPQARAHGDLLGIDIRSGKTHGLHADLMELPVAALLRPFVAEHRSHVPQALGAVVEQVVLQHGAHA